MGTNKKIAQESAAHNALQNQEKWQDLLIKWNTI
jgi:dsRNA-specific ribonuclease